MGNLEKVLIVIILATIAVITALAFLDFGEDPVTEFETARTAEENAERKNDSPDDPSPLKSYFDETDRKDGNVESLIQIPVTPPAEPVEPDDDQATNEADDLTSDIGSGDGTDPAGADTTDPAAGDPAERNDESAPPRLDTRAIDPAPPTPTPRRNTTYRPGSRKYVTIDGDNWRTVAETVYNDASLAEAVREANSDVSEPLTTGTTLYIVPRAELEQERAEAAREGTTHRVKKGETLSAISRLYYQSERRWREILDANDHLLETDRDLKPGMVLRIPPK